MVNIDNLLSTRQGGDYQRDTFDYFLKKNPLKYSIPSIHIAGTNGKGSTANYIASIYQKAGYKVGLFTSPSLIEINEMIRVNGEMISDETISKYISNNKKLFEKFDLSFFEVITYIALSYFQEQQCDIAVIECGMGGEIDATNIITPVLSIITSVSLEHTSYLGRSISEIALMKAGIIKDDIPVLTGELSEDAMNVISDVCKARHSHLTTVSLPGGVVFDNGFTFNYTTYLGMHIQSLAKYSVDDAVFAIDAITILQDKFPVNEQQVKEGLASMVMPARMEVVHENPRVIVDGAHNPEAMEKLVKSLEIPAQGKPIHTIFACFRDKNLNSLLSFIGEPSVEITLTTFDNPRARTFEDYFLFAEDHQYEEDCIKAIKDKMEQYPNDVILVTGSLAFAGYISDLFKKGQF